MDIPWQRLDSDTLQALVEEFVTRCGTDYGSHEASLRSKVEDVLEQLREGKARIVFDSESETVDIREALPPLGT